MDTGEGRVKLVADVALLARDRVLLVRYTDTNTYDHQRGWFLPDDLVAHGEHPDQAAARILREQLGLAGISPRIDHVESFTGNDRSWHLDFHYRADLDAEPALAPSAGLATAEWFALDALPDRAAVAHHGWALDILATITGRQPQPASA